jgi:hypothetical protein
MGLRAAVTKNEPRGDKNKGAAKEKGPDASLHPGPNGVG